MKIAAYNVENHFDRAKAFDEADASDTKSILDATAELNNLFEKERYSEGDLERMRALFAALGLERSDRDPLVHLRQIRGRIVSRSRDEPLVFRATGRGDWIGWVELKTAPVNERAFGMR